MKKILCIALALAMVFALAACGTPAATESTEPVADSTGAIKIGGIGPLTGAAAVYGIAT